MARSARALLDTGQSTVGWHRHGTVLVCPQKYEYSYVRLVERMTSDAPALGTLVHAALAHHYALIGNLAVVTGADAIHPPHDAIDACAKRDGSEHLVAQAHAIFNDYIRFWSPPAELDRWEILAVEREIQNTIDGQLYTQRVDLITRERSTGKVYFWDHKTAGGFGQAYGIDQYGMSGQVLGLRWLGEHGPFDPFGGVYINLIRTRPTGEPRDRFLRGTPPEAPGASRRFEDAVREARTRIEVGMRTGRWPQVLDPTVCFAYKGCEYLNKCRWGS